VNPTGKRQPGTVILHRQPGTPAVLDVAQLRKRLTPGDRLLPGGVASVLALPELGLVVMTSETASKMARAWQEKVAPHEAATTERGEKQ
jgi:hypothetical protein